MDRPNAAASPPPEPPNPAKVATSVANTYIILIGELTFICCCIVWIVVVAVAVLDPVAKLSGMALGTVYFTVLGLLLILLFKPAYIESYPLNPNHAACALVFMAVSAYLIRHFLHQTNFEDRFEIVLFIPVVIAGTILLNRLLAFSTDKLSQTELGYVFAFVVASFVFVAAFLAVPFLFGDRPRIERQLLIANVELFVIDWLGVLIVLALHSTPNTTKVPILDGWAGAVIKNKRIDRLVLNDKEAVISKKKEEVQQVDLRLRITSIRHEFEAKDTVKAYVNIVCCWQVKCEDQSVRDFMTKAQSPDDILRRQFRSIVADELGKSNSNELIASQKTITDKVRDALSTSVAYLGIQVASVNIIDLHTRYPSMAQGGSATVEAMRLDQLDDAIRRASTRTIDHLQTVWESQAYGEGVNAKS